MTLAEQVTASGYNDSTLFEKRIYLVDLSGSIAGKGSVPTADVFGKIILDLDNVIDKAQPNTDFAIIPFAENILKITESSDPSTIHQAISKLTVQNSNTNISKAWAKGLQKIDSTKINYLFLLSDGIHNRGIPKSDLYNILRQWPSLASKYNANAYFVLLNPDYAGSEIAKIFDEEDNMFVVSSMDVSYSDNRHSDSMASKSQDSSVNNISATDNNSKITNPTESKTKKHIDL